MTEKDSIFDICDRCGNTLYGPTHFCINPEPIGKESSAGDAKPALAVDAVGSFRVAGPDIPPTPRTEAQHIADMWADPDNYYVVGDTKSNNDRRRQQEILASAFLKLERDLVVAQSSLSEVEGRADRVKNKLKAFILEMGSLIEAGERIQTVIANHGMSVER